MMSFLAIYLGRRSANHTMSFGYHRAEILGALASILLIWGIVVYLVIEAISRIIHPSDIDGEIMLITALIGLACNIVSILTLQYYEGGYREQSEASLRRRECHQRVIK